MLQDLGLCVNVYLRKSNEVSKSIWRGILHHYFVLLTAKTQAGDEEDHLKDDHDNENNQFDSQREPDFEVNALNDGELVVLLYAVIRILWFSSR